jgi:hypothetical protein
MLGDWNIAELAMKNGLRKKIIMKDIHKAIADLIAVDNYLVGDNRTDSLEVESYRMYIADAISILWEYDDELGFLMGVDELGDIDVDN